MKIAKSLILALSFYASARALAVGPAPATAPAQALPRDAAEPYFHNKSLSQWTNALGEANPEIRARAAAAIGQMDLRARASAPQLAELLTGDADVRVRQEAARSLLAMGSAARPQIPALIAALKDADSDVRQSAILALGGMGSDAAGASSALAPLMSDPDETLGRTAAGALARLGPAGDAALLNFEAKTSSPPQRMLALSAMAELEHPSPADLLALRAALADSSPEIRLKAAEALERYGPASAPATGTLTTALADSSAAVATQAARALAAIGPEAKSSLGALRAALVLASQSTTAPSNQGYRVYLAAAIWSIAHESGFTVPIFVSGASNEDAAVRAHSMELLGRTGVATVPVLQALVNGLNDADGEARFTSINALGQIGPAARAATGSLRALFKEKQPVLQLLAAGALWRIDQSFNEVAPTLNDLLANPDWTVRDGATSAIGELGPVARGLVPQVRAGLKDDSLYVRVSAALAEWRITGDPEESVAALLKIAGDRNARDPFPRLSALGALGKIGPAAGDARAAVRDLESDDFASVRAAAQDARGKIEAPPTTNR